MLQGRTIYIGRLAKTYVPGIHLNWLPSLLMTDRVDGPFWLSNTHPRTGAGSEANGIKQLPIGIRRILPPSAENLRQDGYRLIGQLSCPALTKLNSRGSLGPWTLPSTSVYTLRRCSTNALNMESVGVALALCPIMLNQLDNYVQGLQTLQSLRTRRYRQHLETYAAMLGSQHAILLNTMGRALGDVVSPDDIRSLLSAPGRAPDPLEDALRGTLGRDYEVFKAMMGQASNILEDLSTRLNWKASEPTVVGSIPKETGSLVFLAVSCTHTMCSSYRGMTLGPFAVKLRRSNIYAPKVYIMICSTAWTARITPSKH